MTRTDWRDIDIDGKRITIKGVLAEYGRRGVVDAGHADPGALRVAFDALALHHAQGVGDRRSLIVWVVEL
ncbi:hypothetical protein [Nonomuraea sp. NPDC048916]|uniref:hypothetical protein n=1 Tax=Nonomuraea sp. NPDC048916 TaxID=3154232 RepID=UPI0033C7EA8A